MFEQNRKTLLVIDDERTFCIAAKDYLENERLEVLAAHSGAEALAVCTRRRPDIVLLDQRLPDGDGHGLVPEILKLNDQIKIVFITAYPTFENAVTAVRSGAHDYLSKPLDMEELRMTVEKAVRTMDLEKVEQVHALQLERERNQTTIIGAEAGLLEAAKLAESARSSLAPVLITGETGTGKGLIAKSIHYQGPMAAAPFVSVNCAALPENLIEAELFGYEKGSFTGAHAAKKGLFEIAAGGTLFLDEIGEMPIHLQSKLLGAIEEGEVRRIGGTVPRSVKVRIIAATNADLESFLGTRFRKDLYYRISVIKIHVPPLRERRQDIRALCEHILQEAVHDRRLKLSEDEVQRLMRYDWPGNVRELKNVLERASLVQQKSEFRPSLLLEPGLERGKPGSGRQAGYGEPPQELMTLEESEQRLIQQTLRHFSGNITQTARALGTSLSTLKRRIRHYQL